MQEKKKLKPIPVEIIAYKCPVCTALLYVKTPDKDITTFTPEGVIEHIRKRIYPALPEGLVFVREKSNYFEIILNEGRMIEGTWNGEGWPLRDTCYERSLAHSYGHKVGFYDVEKKNFFSDHKMTVFSKDIRKRLGKNIRLLTIDEFSDLQTEFLKLKKDPQKYAESPGLAYYIDYFLSLDKLIRTTPELEKLVSRL
ncbi:hypothetical protein HYU07_02615 [Candidatus Woesearchaeota archaeon]|nr:hypothetical protein [Candidatus Woesearchaeota archaeon]